MTEKTLYDANRLDFQINRYDSILGHLNSAESVYLYAGNSRIDIAEDDAELRNSIREYFETKRREAQEAFDAL